MKHNYEMIVLDLDGTLTNSKKEVTEATNEVFERLKKTGKKIVLASGRPVAGVWPVARELDRKSVV